MLWTVPIPSAVRLFGVKSTLITLSCLIVLIIAGTIAQISLSPEEAQERFFRSFFVYWHPSKGGLAIPIFPGGYLLGGLLCLNITALLLRKKYSLRNHFGIVLIHIAILLLILGETLGSIFTKEGYLPLKVGEQSNQAIDIVKDRPMGLPFIIELTEWNHETHQRTEIPKHFSSKVAIYAPDGHLLRKATIAMNQPLRYRGKTFYQAGIGQEGMDSILKVVSNPCAITPYLFSSLLILGLFIHFSTHCFSRKIS